ncbi:CAP domain-containing protein [Cecembia sp.]|uniref:CAP domain-containing protein n=1 Tax=Cecembia sp. TaxID=1898110 RepID=UPI0025B8F73F|nr:CAP domain-containing protein [Cecembia sp.]
MMRITQKLKWQALINIFFLTFFLSACHESSEINPSEKELINEDLILPSSFNALGLLNHLNKVRLEGCECEGESMPAVGSLVWNNLLYEAAQRHSEDMFQNNFLDHIGSDNSTFTERVNETGYPWRLLGENLARGNFSEESVIEAWKRSGVHCRLMMQADFLEIGVGKKEQFWTMILAR